MRLGARVPPETPGADRIQRLHTGQSPVRRPRTLVVAPAYNEQGKIGEVVRKTRETPCVDSVVVVDDASRDDTSEEARSAGAAVIRHVRNRGAGAAIRTGISFGLARGFYAVAVIAGDGQHVPAELPRVVRPVSEGRYDFVQGSRFVPGGAVRGRRTYRTTMNRTYAFLFSLLAGRHVTDGTNGLRCFRLGMLSEIAIDLDQDWLDGYELEPYLLYRAIRGGVGYAEVPCTVHYRMGVRTTHMRPFVDWWRLARPMFLLAMRLEH